VALRVRSVGARHGALNSLGRPMKSLARIRNRFKRCYELTARAMMHEPEEQTKNWRVIHGFIYGGIRHAWIDLRDGRIYESRDHKYYTRKEFKGLFKPQPVRSYTLKSLCKAISKCGAYAYCFEDPRVCRSCGLGIKKGAPGPHCAECAERRKNPKPFAEFIAGLEGGR
jgi:hypothetical protein